VTTVRLVSERHACRTPGRDRILARMRALKMETRVVAGGASQAGNGPAASGGLEYRDGIVEAAVAYGRTACAATALETPAAGLS
jgi:hypothetical protein